MTRPEQPSPLSSVDVGRVREALATKRYTTGLTHGFYHYPARFPPEVARVVIEAFSAPGDWILDPFMGGGTSVIEGLALGRRVLGCDVNALAQFVSDVRTTPLSPADAQAARAWAGQAADRLAAADVAWVERPWIKNLPNPVEVFMAGAVDLIADLGLPRRQRFARCALLRLGQWALDCRDFDAPRRKRLARQLPRVVNEMIAGLAEFVAECQRHGVRKREISGNRVLLRRSAVGLETDAAVRELSAAPRLVFTSPPYPGVHVLYHRWQYRGRKETAAPYWIASVPDGYGASYYMLGSRTPTGLRAYFDTITGAFRSVRAMMPDDGLVVQLIGFSQAATQLPLYLAAMRAAGFDEVTPGSERLGRGVPNRKWYAKLQGPVDAASEHLLFHRPRV